jgi:hypothetical protein
MNTAPTHPIGRRRLTTGIIITAAAGALVGALATTTLADRPAADTHVITSLGTARTSLHHSADTVERRMTPRTVIKIPCPPDAAERWQIPNIPVAELPHSADAAERWLTPEIAVADLPYSADTAERVLCAR